MSSVNLMSVGVRQYLPGLILEKTARRGIRLWQFVMAPCTPEPRKGMCRLCGSVFFLDGRNQGELAETPALVTISREKDDPDICLPCSKEDEKRQWPGVKWTT